MLIPIPYSPDLTSLPKVPTIQTYTTRDIDYSTPTHVESKPEYPPEESTLTEIKPSSVEETTDEKNIISSYIPGGHKTSNPIEELSESYIEYNTKVLINRLINEFTLWQTLGTDEGLIHISNIQDLLEDYEPYLKQNPKNRLLFSTLQLIVKNNNWENVKQGQLKQLTIELKRFNEGEVDWDNLDMFAKQLYRNKIKIIQTI